MSKLGNVLAEAWRPIDRRTPWQWGEENVREITYSPKPGPFRTDTTPWIREPMEAIVNPSVKLVSIIAAVQASKSLLAEVALSYIVANLPGPTLWLNQNDDEAYDTLETRLLELFKYTPPVKNLMSASRTKSKKDFTKFNNGMTLWVRGAYNKKNLQRRSIRWVFGDETWQWPTGNMAEAEARTTAFGWLGKCVFFSQGSEWEDDTHKKFLSTDQREWCYKCPHCGEYSPYRWEDVEWDSSAKDDETGEWDYEKINSSTALKCPHCGEYIADTDKNRYLLNQNGKYISQNPKASQQKVGFHWNSLCSMSWGALAEMYLRAKKAADIGDISDLKNFYQKRLGVFWQELTEDFHFDVESSGYKLGEEWDEESAINRKGAIVSPPFDTGESGNPLIVSKLRFLTVDVQQTCFYAVVRSWTAEGSSRLLWYDKLTSWEDIEALAQRFKINPSFVFIDCGYATQEVYRKCAQNGWYALRGDNKASYLFNDNGQKVYRFYSPVRTVYLGTKTNGEPMVAKMLFWSNLNIKDALNKLKRNQNPSRGVTWELPSDISDDYLKMLDSEHRIKKGNTFVWEQIGRRPNHYWDCEAMQVVVAFMLKIFGRGEETKSANDDNDVAK